MSAHSTPYTLPNPTDNQPAKPERFKTALVFTLWGPPIGTLPILLLFALTGFTDVNIIQNITSAFSLAFYSYLPGIIPAAISGAIFQRWLYRSQPNDRCIREVFFGFIIGYSTTAIYSFLIFSMLEPGFLMPLLIGLIGGFSGAVCACFDKRRRRKKNILCDVQVSDIHLPLRPK